MFFDEKPRFYGLFKAEEINKQAVKTARVQASFSLKALLSLAIRNFLKIFVFCLLALLQLPACKSKKSTVVSASPKVTQHPTKTNTPTTAANQSFRSQLQLSEAEVKTNKLYLFSEQWYGSPYKYGGCERSGVDCSCFVNVLYQQVYGKTLARSAADMFKSCETLELEKMSQGDLVFFKIGGSSISHVGVLLKGNFFIHASTSRGVMVNSLDEAYYKKYFYCAGKLKKL